MKTKTIKIKNEEAPHIDEPFIEHETGHKEADRLNIGGLVKFTTIDYEQGLSAVVFLRGCPWRCLYCQNKDLQNRFASEGEEKIDWAQIEAFLNKRKGLLDAVVFSGGEPLTDPALFRAIEEVKSKGFKIGLETAGIYPRKLAEILPLLNWIGLDIKAPLEKPAMYEKITGKPGSAEAAGKSLDLVVHGQAPYEVRTTAHPSYLTDSDIELLAQELLERGVVTFALQIYHQPPQAKPEDLLDRVGSDYPTEETNAKLKSMFKKFVLRR